MVAIPSTAPVLSDGTVTLRAHRRDDAPRVLEQCTDPASQEWTTIPVPYLPAMAEAYVTEVMPAGWRNRTEAGFAIEVDGRYAGSVSLRDEGDGLAEIAFVAHPGARGTGAVERALRLLLEWGFTEAGFTAVAWRAYVGNWASRRLAWRLGFVVEGTLRSALSQRGVLRDAWVGTLLADDPRGPRSTWLERPVLEGDGVRLRPMVETDVRRVVEAGLDARTQQWLGFMFPSPWTTERATAVVHRGQQAAADGRGVNWAIADPATDVLLGWVNIFGVRPGDSAELGYWAHPEARGRGVVTSAVALAAQHARDALDLRVLRAKASVANTASRHVLEANGFEHVGLERLGDEVAGQRVDLATYDKVLVP